jgi:hypothetical protein
MECANCGGLVTWKGPWDSMYKHCQGCGVTDGDTVEELREQDEQEEAGE